jgi:hypothetical protein
MEWGGEAALGGSQTKPVCRTDSESEALMLLTLWITGLVSPPPRSLPCLLHLTAFPASFT